MHAEDLMTRHVHTCSMTDTLADAARAMWDNDIGWLPVLDHKRRLIAVVTDRDICMGGMFQSKALARLKVEEVMSKQLFTAALDYEIGEVEFAMRRHQLRRLPVVDDEGELVGVVTLTDVVRALERGIGDGSTDAPTTLDTLAAITRSRNESSRILGAPHRDIVTADVGPYSRSAEENDVWLYD